MNLPLSRIAEVIAAAGGFPRDAVASGYSIDTRTLKPGDLFFAVKGERLDGHDFIQQALARGAVAAVVGRSQNLQQTGSAAPWLVVDDPLAALQRLAGFVRTLWGKPVIGITGSVGKTTTKDAVAHVLQSRYRVHKSEGNLNNHFGLPLMLLRIQPEHELAVIEMGMSHAGEIAALARIAQPTIGVFTCVAPVHLEFFSSIAGIAEAKRELMTALPETGVAVLNADDEYVAAFGRGFKGQILTYGVHRPAAVKAENVISRGPLGSSFDVVAGGDRRHCDLALVGEHNVANALAAIATALSMGLALEQAGQALASLAPADKRGQVLHIDNVTVINDCYNSNPKALQAMVNALAGMPAGRRIVVAGEMLELGPSAEELHRASGRHLAERGIDFVMGVRGLARELVESARAGGILAIFVDTPQEAGEWLARETRAGDVVLLKASRGVKLELALEVWKLAANSRSLASRDA